MLKIGGHRLLWYFRERTKLGKITTEEINSFFNFLFLKLEQRQEGAMRYQQNLWRYWIGELFSPLDDKQSSKQVRTTKLHLGIVPLSSEKYVLCYTFNFLTFFKLFFINYCWFVGAAISVIFTWIDKNFFAFVIYFKILK